MNYRELQYQQTDKVRTNKGTNSTIFYKLKQKEWVNKNQLLRLTRLVSSGRSRQTRRCFDRKPSSTPYVGSFLVLLLWHRVAAMAKRTGDSATSIRSATPPHFSLRVRVNHSTSKGSPDLLFRVSQAQPSGHFGLSYRQPRRPSLETAQPRQ